jgi:uncharacterized SAM-binding protein YcdF (DUF218 family)
MSMLLLFVLILLSGCFAFFRCVKSSVVMFMMAVVSFVSIGGGFLPHMLLNRLQKNYMPLENPIWQKQNAMILLGAGALHVPGENKIEPTMIAYSRIYEAARLYFSCKKKSAGCSVIVSGGDATAVGESEAVIYQKALLDLGVASSDIILEQKSRNTYQNAEFTDAILQKQSFNQVVLVTSGIHMERALLYFSAFGVKPTPAPSDYLSAITSYFPLGYNFAMADFALHEYLGVARFHLYNFLGWNKRNTAPGSL